DVGRRRRVPEEGGERRDELALLVAQVNIHAGTSSSRCYVWTIPFRVARRPFRSASHPSAGTPAARSGPFMILLDADRGSSAVNAMNRGTAKYGSCSAR